MLNGEDLSSYSNKIESVSLRKCPCYHYLHYKNRKLLSVPRSTRNRRSPLLSSAMWQQTASHASTDSACRHPVWLPHSSLGFQRPVGRHMRCTALLRLTPQATIALRAIVACLTKKVMSQHNSKHFSELAARHGGKTAGIDMD